MGSQQSDRTTRAGAHAGAHDRAAESKRSEPLAAQSDSQSSISAEGVNVTSAGDTASREESKPKSTSAASGRKVSHANNVRKLRMEQMMSKAELARRAGLSTLTVDRVERGLECRMDTKRKILEALGLTPSDRVSVFGDEE